MENFKFGDNEVTFYSYSGDVISHNKYSETSVSSSGGGGVVSQHGGYISAPQISSNTVTKQDVWIRKEDGSEKSIQLSGYNIPIREGQKISLICSKRKGQETGYYTVLVNHSEEKHWYLNKADYLNKNMKLTGVTGKSILFAVIIYFLAFIIAENFNIWADVSLTPWKSPQSAIGHHFFALMITTVFLIYRFTIFFNKYQSFLKYFNDHLESVAVSVYRNT